MGLGVTGLANAGEMLGFEYGSADFLTWMATVFETLRDETYRTSAELAGEKGTFPLYNAEKHLAGKFIQTLSEDVINLIEKNGIRNSHLTSIAPTGTISLCADNVSGGIEPVFSHYYDRTIQTFNGPIVERVEDYAYSKGVEGKSANDISVQNHLEVLLMAQKYIDSACSKTCNVGDDVSYDEFKQVYVDAWKGGAKGCTTFRLSGKRFGIFNQETVEEEKTIHGETQEMATEKGKVEACFIDPLTGQKECS
jgi:ribonucleoside-diphosphate reductase alpha chain